jgi:hypothetical protein
MPFKAPQPPEVDAETPEQLFGALPRSKKGHSTLWLHQGDILRTYYDKFRAKSDVAVELPTGTGKTLTGLLMADWNRRHRKVRVLYACPTVQLVSQVMRSAERQNIPVVDLSGRWREWNPADLLKFEQAKAVAIVSYNTIFNSNPHVSNVDTILFDDAHAGEQYVAGSYSLEVDRSKEPGLYDALRVELAPHLPSGVATRLSTATPDAVAWNGVNVVLPAANGELAAGLERAILENTQPFTPMRFSFSVLDGHLNACLVYVKWQKIFIRPFIPPTFENALFIGARQRIYLSATLGASGEMERAFGRQKIDRLQAPPAAGTPRAGRRFFVFPTQVRGSNPDEVTRQLIAKAGRAIVLTPSGAGVTYAEKHLVPEGWKVFGKSQVEGSFDTFAKTPHAVSILANRYDGIDLPAEACRNVVLLGYPRATHPQEEFLAVRARATSAMAERIRSRVIQGTGRCTRGPEDYALVVIGDVDTTTYLARPDVQNTLDPALQAEVQFGLANSDVSKADLFENVDHFLAQDDVWQNDAETEISTLQVSLARSDAPGSVKLGAAVNHEVVASELAWQSVWAEASAEAATAAQTMAGEPEISAYRALWLLLSAYYANAAVVAGGGSSTGVVDGYVKAALLAAQPQTWIREVTPFPGTDAQPLPPFDTFAAQTLANRLANSKFNAAKNISQLEEMMAGLRETDPNKYEPALTLLGGFLGADAFKPDAQGNCDSAWCWGNDMWITVEAKSDESAGDGLSIESVRQANTHLAILTTERGGAVIPHPNAASVIVSPRRRIDAGAVTSAQQHAHLMHVDDMLSLGEDVSKAWQQIRQLRNAEPAAVLGLVQELLQSSTLLPSDIFQRMTARSIGSD